MTRKEFIAYFGEDPIDVLGADWEEQLEDLTWYGIENAVKKHLDGEVL
jgi:hypothetical protein